MSFKDSKTRKIWSKADECNCNDGSCHPNSHRLCSICGGKMVFGAHESVESQANSNYRWNIDHIIPKSKNGSDEIKNLQAAHVWCNKNKKNKW